MKTLSIILLLVPTLILAAEPPVPMPCGNPQDYAMPEIAPAQNDVVGAAVVEEHVLPPTVIHRSVTVQPQNQCASTCTTGQVCSVPRSGCLTKTRKRSRVFSGHGVGSCSVAVAVPVTTYTPTYTPTTVCAPMNMNVCAPTNTCAPMNTGCGQMSVLDHCGGQVNTCAEPMNVCATGAVSVGRGSPFLFPRLAERRAHRRATRAAKSNANANVCH